MSLALTDLVYLQVTPLAQATIGWKFWLVFIVISGLGAVVLFFVLPETKGLSLEQIGLLFGDDDVVVYAGGDGARPSDKSVGERSGSDVDEVKQVAVEYKEHV